MSINKLLAKSALLCLLIWNGSILLAQESISENITETRKLHLFFTGGLHGAVKADAPNVQGDILRVKAALQEKMSRDRLSAEDVLIVDTGNALSLNYHSKMDSGRTIVREMIQTGYEALTLAEWDINFGYENLVQLNAMGSSLPFLTTNVNLDTTSLILPYKILNKDGLRIGILGVVEKSLSERIFNKKMKDIKVEDPESAILKALKEIKSKCDLIIAVNHIDLAENLDITRRVPGIDVIISKYSEDSLNFVQTYSYNNQPRSLVVKSPPDATAIGHLEIDFSIADSVYRMNDIRLNRSIPVATRDYKGIDLEPFEILEQRFQNYTPKKYGGLLPDEELAKLGDDPKAAIFRSTMFSMLKATRSEIAILHNHDIIMAAFAPEDTSLTIRNVESLFRPFNPLVTLRIRGKDLKAALQRSKKLGIGHSSRLHTLAIKNYGPEEPKQGKIHGLNIQDNNLYAVVTSLFLAEGRDGYTSFTKATHRRARFIGDIRLNSSRSPEAHVVNPGEHLIRYIQTKNLVIENLEEKLKKDKLLNKPLWAIKLENINFAYKSVQVQNNELFPNANDRRVEANTRSSRNISTNGYLALITRNTKFRWENGINFRFGFEEIQGSGFQESDDRLEIQSIIDWDAFNLFKKYKINTFISLRYDTEFTRPEDDMGMLMDRRKDLYLFGGLSHLGKHKREYRLALFGKRRFTNQIFDGGLEANFKYFKTFKFMALGSIIRARYLFPNSFEKDIGDEKASLDFTLFLDFNILPNIGLKPQINWFVYQDTVLKQTATNLQFSLNFSYNLLWKYQYIKLLRKDRPLQGF